MPAASAPVAAAPKSVPQDEATIGKSLVIKGEVTGSESLYIDGRVEGSINLPGNRVTVGRNGVVVANVTAREIVVVGKLRGNLAASDRLSLFLMDYPRRERLKILGRARVLDAREHRDIADQLTPSPDLREKVERLFLIDVVSFDWNCPQFITPRYTEEEVRAAVAPLKQRIAELEAKLAGNSCPH